MRLACLLLLTVALVFGAHAQEDFRAFASSLNLIEGGKIDTMVAVTPTQRYTVRVPKGYTARVEAEKKSVVLTDAAGALAITVQWTTNSPGAMPDDETLRRKALAANPGGAVLQLATCSTGYQPGKFVDTVRILGQDLQVKMRHAFVAAPEGTVEFIFSSNAADFEKGRVVLNLVLLSFQVATVKKTD